MNLSMYFDTETTGLPDFRAPSDADHQPHLVQLAILLLDEEFVEHAAVNVIIKPDGWVIPDEVAAIHGITTEMALERGIPEAEAVQMFLDHRDQAARTVAHNINFDRRIMRIALMRMGRTREEIEVMEAAESVCTMRLADAIMKLPPTEKMRAAGFTKSKPPNLGECVEFFYGEKLEGAHDAMVDVRACARVHQEILARAAAADEAA